VAVIFLPVVERELRVAARKRSTFWTRVAAALVALVIGSGVMILVSIGGAVMPAPTMGKVLFGFLTWLSLAAALMSGCFFTSDCLSEEKREGTLGFLFLTDLRGYDVVLGKLLATSLRGFFTFIAVFPVLAITVLMGGVPGAELWRTSVALTGAMFLSLATGMFVSSISRDPQRAMGGTLLLLIALSALGPAIDALTSKTAFAFSSPVYLFVSAGGLTGNFWMALAVNLSMAAVLFGISCVLLPRTWQVKARQPTLVIASWQRRITFGGAARQHRLRTKLLALNPVLWLACRERWQAAAAWVMAVLALGFLITCVVQRQSAFWMAWGYLFGIFTVLLYLIVASQSNRFFVEAQRSGLNELLLATPITVHQIVQGQWRALLRLLAVPLGLCLIAQLIGATMAQRESLKTFGAATAAAAATAATNATAVATNSSGAVIATPIVSIALGGPAIFDAMLPLASGLMSALTTLYNLLALAWFGMWMGMTSKTNHLATLKTFVFVQVVPWFAIAFISGIVSSLLMFSGGLMGAGTPRFNFAWYQMAAALVTTALCLGKDAAFIFWARKKLHSEFRTRATRTPLPILPPKIVRLPTVTGE